MSDISSAFRALPESSATWLYELSYGSPELSLGLMRQVFASLSAEDVSKFPERARSRLGTALARSSAVEQWSEWLYLFNLCSAKGVGMHADDLRVLSERASKSRDADARFLWLSENFPSLSDDEEALAEALDFPSKSWKDWIRRIGFPDEKKIFSADGYFAKRRPLTSSLKIRRLSLLFPEKSLLCYLASYRFSTASVSEHGGRRKFYASTAAPLVRGILRESLAEKESGHISTWLYMAFSDNPAAFASPIERVVASGLADGALFRSRPFFDVYPWNCDRGNWVRANPASWRAAALLSGEERLIDLAVRTPDGTLDQSLAASVLREAESAIRDGVESWMREDGEASLTERAEWANNGLPSMEKVSFSLQQRVDDVFRNSLNLRRRNRL